MVYEEFFYETDLSSLERFAVIRKLIYPIESELLVSLRKKSIESDCSLFHEESLAWVKCLWNSFLLAWIRKPSRIRKNSNLTKSKKKTTDSPNSSFIQDLVETGL